MTPIESIDAELAKLAPALHATVMAEDHERHTVLIADANDLLDRRLSVRPARPQRGANPPWPVSPKL